MYNKSMKKLSKEKKCSKNLVVCCVHILKAVRAKKKIAMFEVLKDTFTCKKCAENEPKTKKAYMAMFVTVCKGCIKGNK